MLIWALVAVHPHSLSWPVGNTEEKNTSEILPLLIQALLSVAEYCHKNRVQSSEDLWGQMSESHMARAGRWIFPWIDSKICIKCWGGKCHWLRGMSRFPPQTLNSGWLVREFKQHLGQSFMPEPSWLFPALLQLLRELLSLGSFLMFAWKQPDFTPAEANAKGLTFSAVSLCPLVFPTLRN